MLAAIFLLLIGGVSLVYPQAGKLTAKQIMVKVDNRKEPQDVTADMTMVLVNKKGYKRTRKVRTVRQGKEKQIMWFLKPADVRGTAFLRIEKEGDFDDMRLYLPAFKKLRRISSSAKGDNFMGSDITYEDMTSRELNEYTYKLLGDSTFESKKCYIVKSAPVNKSYSEYGHIVSWVWKDEWIIVYEKMYDKQDKLLKIKTLSNFETIKSYKVFHMLKVENVKKAHSTILKMENIELDTGIEPEIFHERNLKRIPQ